MKAARAGSTRRLRSLLALAATSTLLALLAAEAITARFFPVYLAPTDYFDDFFVPDPELGYRMRPGFAGTYRQDYTSRIEVNSLGLRDREYGPRRPSIPRILAVGDSFTFGDGVELIETWPKQLEQALHASGLAAEIVNAGTSGYGTLQYAALVRRLLPIYSPDLVIVMVTFNDPGNDVATEKGIFPPLKTGQHPAKRWLKRHSHLAMRAWLAWLSYAQPAFSFGDAGTLHLHQSSPGPRGERSRHGFDLFDRAVHDLIRATDEAGIPIVFTASDDLRNAVSLHLAEFCAREGKPFVDVFRRVNSGEVEIAWGGRNSAGHWSPAGHAEFAHVLVPEVIAALGADAAEDSQSALPD